MVEPLTAPEQGWRIRYDCLLGDVPPEAMAELLLKLRLVADELALIEPGSGVWPRLREGEMRLEAAGWRFAYSVPRRGVLAVRGAHAIPPAT